jgi:hypothetical protein
MRNFSIKKLLLDLLAIVCLVAAGWVGYRLFVQHTIDPVPGSIIFIVSIGVLVWNISVLRSYRYRLVNPSFTLIFFSLIGIVLILTFAGVQPFAAYKDAVVSKMNAIREGAGGVIPANIATVESKWVTFDYRGGYYLTFALKPENAVAGVSYVAELYERGKLRTTKVIRFSQDEINLGRVKEVTFELEEADFAGLVLGDLSIFDVKVVP